ncbi:T9SS type A sorting domain-containing protein [bacterium]|nr:T9SS type A sorting domain-containing protein [bacterium]
MSIRTSLFLTVLVLTLIFTSSFAWIYHGNYGYYHDEARDIVICADGGFFITGRSLAWAAGDYDWEVFLAKIDAMGNEEWVNHYGQIGEGYYDAGWSLCATPDSGCLIAGKTQSPQWCSYPYWDNMLLVRVDKYGDTLWTNAHGGYYFDRAWSIISIPGTNEFYIAGCTHTHGPGTPDADQSNMWVMRVDSLGNIIYQNAWGNFLPGTSDCRWCCLAHDGGVVIAGNTADHDTTYTEDDTPITRRICKTAVVKYDEECNQEWERIYDNRYFHYTRGITPSLDSGYVVTTYDWDPNVTWVLKLDIDGDTLWTKHISLDSTGTRARVNYYMVCPAPDSGFYFAGGGGGAAVILYLDQHGNEVWEYGFDWGSESENFLSCKMTPDSGCVATGVTYSYYHHSYMDVFAGRVDRWGHDVSYYHLLSGWVFDQITMEPIAGVNIYDTTSTYSTTSLHGDSVGIYYIDDIVSGNYTFKAEHPDYRTRFIDLSFSTFGHQDFYLIPAVGFNLSGMVVDESEVPIDGAILTAVTAEMTIVDTSCCGGHYLLGDIPGYMVATVTIVADSFLPETLCINLRNHLERNIRIISSTRITDRGPLTPQKSDISCYPNPFNASCRIEVLESGKLQDITYIRIYDLLGNLVEQFGPETFADNRVTWTPEPILSSGIYLISCSSGDMIINKRIVLLK